MLFAVYFVPNCFWFALSYCVSVGVHVCLALCLALTFLCLNYFFLCYNFLIAFFLSHSVVLVFFYQSSMARLLNVHLFSLFLFDVKHHAELQSKVPFVDRITAEAAECCRLQCSTHCTRNVL